ncbi:unnamed protein product [Adineta ricciae]|uniref:G-protein coupled receptors family 1 profile domain-containing protein n=1 Tax=Adineta ricciae TaxID=249248 RepID=A0A814D7L9_ADIRI|nr:unnamed protein product [Adineta ricciae]CAF0950550.1 unnamed protein product [Adineta ricciae]
MTSVNLTLNSTHIADEFTNILGIIQGAIYIPIFCAGLANNLLTILIISLNRDMKTVTNCYLLNLAISDTLPLIVSLPFEIEFLRIKAPWERLGCQIRALLAETSTNASILTISAFTIERYLAVCHPLRDASVSTFGSAIKIQIIIWFFAILSSTPYFYLTEIVNSECFLNPKYAALVVICFHISTIVFFVLPAFILCLLYALMARRLYNIGLLTDPDSMKEDTITLDTGLHSGGSISQNRVERRTLPTDSVPTRQSLIRHERTSSRRLSLHIQSMKKSAFKMLFAVVIAFIICYAPFHMQRLITSRPTAQLSQTQQRVYRIFYFISGILYYIGATVNPIFYHLFSRKYRLACIRTMKRIVHCKRHYRYPIIQRKNNSLPVLYYPRLHGMPLKPTENMYRIKQRRKTSIDIGFNRRHIIRLSVPPLTLKQIR